MDSSSEELVGMRRGSRAFKRLKLEEDEEEQQEEDQEVTRFSPGSVDLVKFKALNVAIKWGKDEFPKKEFLAQLGLGCLAEVDWTVTSSPLIKEFVTNYNFSTAEAKVGGLVIRLNPDMISEVLRVPNRGLKVAVRKVKQPDYLNFFKDGSYSVEQGFRNDMAKDASLTQIFSLISEVLLLKSVPTYTSTSFLDALSRAMEGDTVNWPLCLWGKLTKKLREVKERMSVNRSCNFTGGAWISHFIKVLSNEDKQATSTPAPAGTANVTAGATATATNVTSGDAAAATNVRSCATAATNLTTGVTAGLDIKSVRVQTPTSLDALGDTSLGMDPFSLTTRDTKIHQLRYDWSMSEILSELSTQAKAEEGKCLFLTEELEVLKKSEKVLVEANKVLQMNKAELKKQNSRLQLELEAKELEKQDALREARGKVKQLEEMNNEHLLTIAALRTQLEAKSFPYGAHVWEKIQSEAWNQVRAAYPLLVETVDNLIARKVDNV